LAVFRFVINSPETRKSFQLEVDQSKVFGLIGKKISDEFDGETIGLSGYKLQITGGTDKDGFPMHPNVKGSGRKKVLLTFPPCFHPKIKGQRKRKMVRGNTISEDMTQINCKVIKKGEKSLDQLIPTKAKEKKEKPSEIEEKKPEEKPKEKLEKKEEKEKLKPEEKKVEEKKKEEPKPEEKKSEEKKSGGEKATEEKT